MHQLGMWISSYLHKSTKEIVLKRRISTTDSSGNHRHSLCEEPLTTDKTTFVTSRCELERSEDNRLDRAERSLLLLHRRILLSSTAAATTATFLGCDNRSAEGFLFIICNAHSICARFSLSSFLCTLSYLLPRVCGFSLLLTHSVGSCPGGDCMHIIIITVQCGVLSQFHSGLNAHNCNMYWHRWWRWFVRNLGQSPVFLKLSWSECSNWIEPQSWIMGRMEKWIWRIDRKRDFRESESKACYC